MTDKMLINLPQPWITFHKFKNKYAGIATDGPSMIKTLIGYYQKKERMRVRNWVQVATRPVGLSHVLHFYWPIYIIDFFYVSGMCELERRFEQIIIGLPVYLRQCDTLLIK